MAAAGAAVPHFGVQQETLCWVQELWIQSLAAAGHKCHAGRQAGIAAWPKAQDWRAEAGRAVREALAACKTHSLAANGCHQADAHLHASLVAQGPAFGAIRQPLGAGANAALALAPGRRAGHRQPARLAVLTRQGRAA